MSKIVLFFKKINENSLVKASRVYMFASFLNAGIPFLLLPILTRYLNPEEYGLVTMFTLLLSIVGAFVGLSVHGAIGREFFNKEIDFKEFVFNCILVLFSSTMLVGVLFLLCLHWLSDTFSLPKEWIFAVLIASFFQFLVLALLTIYQVQMKAKQYAFIQISQSLINISFTGFFVMLLMMGWQGRVGAVVLASIVMGLISFVLLMKEWCVFRVNVEYIKSALRFGVPLIPHTLGAILIVVVDRLIIHEELGIFEVGIYTAGLQIGKVIGLVTDALNKAYAPWLFSKLDEHDKKENLNIIKFTYLYFIVLIVLVIALGILAPYIVHFILGKEFTHSVSVIFWIALGEAFTGMYFMVVGYIFYTRKTFYLMMITFFTGIFCIPLTYTLVHYNGLIGAGQAYAISLFVSFLLTWWYASKTYPMPWAIRLR